MAKSDTKSGFNLSHSGEAERRPAQKMDRQQKKPVNFSRLAPYKLRQMYQGGRSMGGRPSKSAGSADTTLHFALEKHGDTGAEKHAFQREIARAKTTS
jgi:hypothetical protein